MIEELYAYVYYDQDFGDEVVLGWQPHSNAIFPCVGPDLQGVKVLGRLALPRLRRSGHTANLVKFSNREVLEEVT